MHLHQYIDRWCRALCFHNIWRNVLAIIKRSCKCYETFCTPPHWPLTVQTRTRRLRILRTFEKMKGPVGNVLQDLSLTIHGEIHKSHLCDRGVSLIYIVAWNSLYLLKGTLKLGSFMPSCASITNDYQMLTNY